MKKHIETIAVHASDFPDLNANAIASPIYLSTTFERNDDGTIGKHLYSRYTNPNRDALEVAMAQIEGARYALAFSSGLAAAMSIIQTLKSGDHIVLPDDAYYGVASQLDEMFDRLGVSYTRADYRDVTNVEAAMRRETRYVWTESPSNPLLKITDLKAVCEIAHSRGALVVCDNTWAPVIQRPIDLGCDIVFHSATKYIGGHSDVLLGIVVLNNEELAQRIKRIQMVGGAVPSPFECWLAARGIKTLPLRIRAQCESAQKIADVLTQHPQIESVLYPSLPTHVNHDVARQQMQLPGAMMSIIVGGSRNDALRIASATKIFSHATSLGAVESLIEHRASVEPSTSKTPGNLLRLSIGLEHWEDLLDDLHQALGS
jgi:cystathionine gamma-synthase